MGGIVEVIEQVIKNFIILHFLPTKRMEEKIDSEKLSTGIHGVLMTLGAIVVVNIAIGLFLHLSENSK